MSLDSIKDRLHRALEGNAWHGDSLKPILAGISAEQAAAHPIPGAHSIWEIVMHITVWHRVVQTRLHSAYEPTDAEDWPTVTQQDEAGWDAAKTDLFQSAEEFLVALDAFAGSLEDTVPGEVYNYDNMLNGLIEHDLYHAGQIALLKKLL